MTVTLPDSEAIVIGYLQSNSLLTSLSGLHVATFIPDSWTGLCIKVTRVGGDLLAAYADNPQIQLECWSSVDDRDGAQAANLAFHAAAAICDFGGTHGDWWACKIVVNDGPTAIASDEERPVYRLVFSFDLYPAAGRSWLWLFQ